MTKSLETEKAIPGGVSNELKPDRGEREAVRRRDDLTIRGADPKEIDPPGKARPQPAENKS